MAADTSRDAIHAQNRVQVCPSNIPLATSISIIYDPAMKQAIGDFLSQARARIEGDRFGHK